MRDSPEFRRIRQLIASTAGPALAELEIGPGDDAAALRVPEGEAVLLSSDMTVEGVHFLREWLTWEAIGYRATASALSDLAAMAARPLGVLLSLAIPPELDGRMLDELAGGVGACLRDTGAALLGGDLSRSPGPVVLDLGVIGTARRPVTRAGAIPGDELWVSGELGAAALAASAWRSGMEPDPGARRAFERPRPRSSEARRLCEEATVHAMIDLSDGLASDAAQMAAASGVRLVIETARVPLYAGLESWAVEEFALALAVGGGEDYELLAALAPGSFSGGGRRRDGEDAVEWVRVGVVEEGSGVEWLDDAGNPIPPPAAGFDHFQSGG
jgi:thiamine-monophosphate kinase